MIVGRRLTVIKKNGVKIDYTHIQHIETNPKELIIEAETDFEEMRANVVHVFPLNDIHIIIFEPYIPPT